MESNAAPATAQCAKSTLSGSTGGCDNFHDGLVCWPRTGPGEQAKVDCLNNIAFSSIALDNMENLFAAFAFRVCGNNSVWAEKADYSECLNLISHIPSYENTTSLALNKRIIANLNLYLSVISLACLILSLMIFSLKSLSCDRIRVHQNFMLSLVLLYVTSIVYFAPYINQQAAGQTVWYKSQPWICQTMKASLMFCFQSPIFWMFVEGIYLHSRVSNNIFNHTPPFLIYYFIGWGLPLLVTLIWVVAMESTTSNDGCWEDYSSNMSIYIIVVPILSILLVNLLFLISIMKVVVTSLRTRSSLTRQQLQVRKAVQSTLILFPLLGITNLLFFINPKLVKRPDHQFIYMLVNSILKSSQGIFLSFLYCFFNSEVQKTLKRLFRRNLTRYTIERSATRNKSLGCETNQKIQETIFTEVSHRRAVAHSSIGNVIDMGCQTDNVKSKRSRKNKRMPRLTDL